MATIRYYTEKYIQAIADAIRAKNGKTRKYKTREMGPAILEMVTYLTHLKQMSGWFLHTIQTGSSTPEFSLDDEESGYAVFDSVGHYTIPALTSKHPKIYLKIQSIDGGFQIYPVLWTDSNGFANNTSDISVYPMTHTNNMPYMTDENNTSINQSGRGANTNITTLFEDSIFSKGSTYIWNIDANGTHPVILDKLDPETHSGVISFTNFSRDFAITDLVNSPRRLDGLIENAIVFANCGYTQILGNRTYFGVFLHTGNEKVYYDTSESRIKSASTMKSYVAPSAYPSQDLSGIAVYDTSTGNHYCLYYNKLDVSQTDQSTIFNFGLIAQEDVSDYIPFRTYDIKDQNGNTIAAKNCNVEDFGIEPKEE